jgi:AMMECR1 domain-containing protein
MKLIIPSVLVAFALGGSACGNDAVAARKAAAAERKAETVRKAEIKSLKQEVQALQSQKTSGAKEYGDKVRAINAKKDVIRAKERQ